MQTAASVMRSRFVCLIDYEKIFFVNITVGLVLKNVYLNHKYCYKSVFGLFGTLSIFCYFYALIFLNKANK